MHIRLSELFPFRERTKEYSYSFEMSNVDSYPVLHKNEERLTVTHHRDRKIELMGDGKIELSIPCARCLKPVSVVVPYEICRKVDCTSMTDEDGEPFLFIQEDELDVDALVLDEIRLSLPAKVLCKEDCKGICFKCGKDLNQGSCDCEADIIPGSFADLLKDF